MSRLRRLTATPAANKADDHLAQARQALAAGRKLEARRWAWEALAADPENVKAWLMLATLASPRASVSYALRALELRPHNPVALRALAWAEARARAEVQDPRGKEQGARKPQDSSVVVAPESTPPPDSAAAALLHVPEAAAQSDEPAAVEAPPEPSAAETLLHAPAVEEAEALAVTLLHMPGIGASKPPAEEEAAEAPPVAATIAEVELPPVAATIAEVEPPPPGLNEAPPADEPVAPLTETVAELEAAPATHAEQPPDEADDEDDAPTSPNKAIKPPWASGPAPLTTLLLAAVAAILGLLYFGGGRYGPQRPAVVAAAPVGYLFKSTLAPAATDTPTVTPSPSATATFTPTPSITPTPSASPTPPPYEAGAGGGEARWIDVNLSRQQLTAMEGSEPVQTFIVSTGLWNTPTVIGDFHVYVKYEAADMSGPGYYLPQVPYVMYFHRDYGLHGTYWHNNFGNPMSHGCVNMRTEEAGWLYNWASVGTLVHVHE